MGEHSLPINNHAGARHLNTPSQRIRPRVILVLVIVIGLLATMLVFGPLLKAPAIGVLRDLVKDQAAPTVPTDKEFAAIILAAIEHSWFEGAPPPPEDTRCSTPGTCRRTVLLSDQSIIVCPGNSMDTATTACPTLLSDEELVWPGADYRIPRRLRMQLAEANRVSKHIPEVNGPHILFTPQEQIDVVFHNPNTLGWSTFYRKFENSAGYIRTSIPVLSDDGTWAAVILEHSCGGLCGGVGLLFLLMRDRDGHWHVVVEDRLWIARSA